MSDSLLRITRNQLAEFLPNPRAIKLFEEMALATGSILPERIDELDTLLTAHIASDEEHGAIGEVVGTENIQTLINKTLTTPIISEISNIGLLTLPASTDTLVGKSTIDTFTNKTYDTAGAGNNFLIDGTAITSVTGTGSVVLSTNPVLVTPDLGTPSALIGTNITGNAAGLSIGGNAATVTTNADLTGVITSVGNTTSIASQTGTGTTFVMSAGSPVFSGTPRLGSAAAIGAAPVNNIGLQVTGTFTGAATSNIGVNSTPVGTSTGTVAISSFSAAPSTTAAVFTVTDAVGFLAQAAVRGAGSTITNATGVYINNQTVGTNNYGLRSLISAGAAKWNIFASGTAQNAFAGNVRIGSTVAPVNTLDVTGTIGVSGQLTSTLATGTAPLVVASTTNVANLNASSLNGANFASPGPIGSTVASTGAFTTLGTSDITTISKNGGDTALLIVSNTGANGAGIKLAGSGGVTPAKYMRAIAGKFEMVNDGYSAVIFSVSDTGTVEIPVPINSAVGVPTVASAAVIAITTPIAFVSGIAAIDTITAPPGLTNGGQITIIPTGVFTTTLAGNIALASTAIASKALIMTYVASTAKWYPSY